MLSIKNKIQTLLPFLHYYSIPFVDNAFQINNSDQLCYNKEAPKIIYGFWTEDNPLTQNRVKAIQSIQENCGTQFKLITKQDLPSYELKEHPYHPSFKYLSAVHKSDYLRTYFMHFYGGGYTDIKPHLNDWNPLFDILNRNTSSFCVGYPETKAKDLANIKHFTPPLANNKKLNSHLRKNYAEIIGNGSYIFKPLTTFTRLWLSECERRLSLSYQALKEHPGNTYGDNPDYPLPWTSILGQVFHPLCLAFRSHIIKNEQIRPICKNYR